MNLYDSPTDMLEHVREILLRASLTRDLIEAQEWADGKQRSHFRHLMKARPHPHSLPAHSTLQSTIEQWTRRTTCQTSPQPNATQRGNTPCQIRPDHQNQQGKWESPNRGSVEIWHDMAMGHNLWLHFGADEHPCTTYFAVHQGFLGFDPQPYSFKTPQEDSRFCQEEPLVCGRGAPFSPGDPVTRVSGAYSCTLLILWMILGRPFLIC